MRRVILLLVVGVALFGREIRLPGTYDIYEYGSSSCQKFEEVRPLRLSIAEERALRSLYAKVVEGKWLYKRLYQATGVRFFRHRKKELNFWIAHFRKVAHKYDILLPRGKAIRAYTRDWKEGFREVLRFERELERVARRNEYRLPPFERDEAHQILRQSQRAQKRLRCVVDLL